MSDIKGQYQYVTNPDGTQQAIGITDKGKYDGVVYRYGKVTFGEEFFTLIGDILVDIIDEKIEDQQLGYTDD